MPNSTLGFATLQILLGSATLCQGATINYSGKVYDERGQPLMGGFVIAGTFAPAFNATGYSCFYGDSACNLNPRAYDKAVADGNFIPAGLGGFTNSTGAFSLTGTSAATGSRVWLFAFENGGRDSFTQTLATSSAPSWLVPAASGSTNLLAQQADQFVLGRDHPDGISLSVIPFPEPGPSFSTLLLSGSILALRHRRRC